MVKDIAGWRIYWDRGSYFILVCRKGKREKKHNSGHPSMILGIQGEWGATPVFPNYGQMGINTTNLTSLPPKTVFIHPESYSIFIRTCAR
jgi:hypothetical protein